MNRPDAIFTDLDGTLLGPDKKVGKQDTAAIRRLKELGIPVIICTGRPILGTRLVTAELGLGLTLCSNGGCCHDFIRDETLLAVEMDHGVARRLLAWLEEEGEPFLLHAPKQIFGSPGAQMPPHYVLQGEESGGTIFHDSPFDGLQILKVLAVRCDEAELIRKGRERFTPEELTICSSERSFVDFNPPGVTKGAGIRWLAEKMGWDLARVIAMGDNNNDLSMLELAGMGAAPESGIPAAKAAADFVTAPSGENPLSATIKHYYPNLLPSPALRA